jgi:ribonucleoside-diphosphate reductase alpha chain
MDYLFRWLGSKFLRSEVEAEGTEEAKPAEPAAAVTVTSSSPVVGLDQTLQVVQTVQTVSKPSTPSMYGFLVRTDAPTCPECGSIMVPNGSCHKCTNCGTTSGCS